MDIESGHAPYGCSCPPFVLMKEKALPHGFSAASAIPSPSIRSAQGLQRTGGWVPPAAKRGSWVGYLTLIGALTALTTTISVDRFFRRRRGAEEEDKTSQGNNESLTRHEEGVLVALLSRRILFTQADPATIASISQKVGKEILGSNTAMAAYRVANEKGLLPK